MSYWHEAPVPRRDGVTIPHIGIAVALSILLHAAVLWQWKFSLRAPGPDPDIKPPLIVQLERLPGPPPSPGADIAPAAQPRAAPRPRAEPPAAVLRAPPVKPQAPPPPVVAMETPAPEAAPSVPARAPPAGDFAAFVEAQRRARGESSAATPPTPAAPAAEDANARATRQAIANLAIPRTPAYGQDPSRSGGVFQLRSKSSDYAEFMFNGWHSEARRNWAQLVEVRKGNHASIELAVVRQMIDIIRKYEQADFPWYSHRMNRTVTLSARPRDSAGLEEFLMREFFFNPRVAP